MKEKELLLQALAGSNADYAEIRIERELRNQVQFQKDKLENLESSSEVALKVSDALKIPEENWNILKYSKRSLSVV